MCILWMLGMLLTCVVVQSVYVNCLWAFLLPFANHLLDITPYTSPHELYGEASIRKLRLKNLHLNILVFVDLFYVQVVNIVWPKFCQIQKHLSTFHRFTRTTTIPKHYNNSGSNEICYYIISVGSNKLQSNEK
jgi:hypothetical protein